MKKRTVITTEKREVWIISEGGKSRVIGEQPDSNKPVEVNESITEEDPPAQPRQDRKRTE